MWASREAGGRAEGKISDLARRATEAREEHGSLRELLGPVVDHVGQVAPQGQGVFVSWWAGGKFAIGQAHKPSPELPLLAMPAVHQGSKARVVLRIQAVRGECALAQPDPPGPLVLELVYEGGAQVPRRHRLTRPELTLG